jgi:hypothetical protein
VLRGKSTISVRWKSLLGVCALVSALSVAGHANPITDPLVGMEPGGDAAPFGGGGVTFTPDPTTGGNDFSYYNDTGQIIVGLNFSTTILSGLTFTASSNIDITPDMLSGPGITGSVPLSCNDSGTTGSPNPFFVFCSINYFPDGLLTFNFSGTNSSEPGIAPLLSTCTPSADLSPDAPGCNGVGFFQITLNTGFSTSGDTGGWVALDSPTFDTSSVQTEDVAPEPAPVVLVGATLFAGAVLSMRRRRKKA